MEAARQQYEAAKNGAAQQYQALQARARARHARAQGARRHRRPRAVRRPRRRAPRLGRRLRHQGHEGRDRRPRQSAARAADGPRAVRRRRSSSASRSPSRSTPIRAGSSRARVRYVSPALEADPARADRRSDRAEPERRAQAGPLRDRAHRAAGADARRARARAPPSRPAAGTSRVFVVNGDHVEERIVTIGQTRRRRSSKSPTASRPASASRRRTSRSSSTASRCRNRREPCRRPSGRQQVHHAVACRALRPPSGLRDGAHPLADRHRRLLVHAARRRSLPEDRLPDRRRSRPCSRARRPSRSRPRSPTRSRRRSTPSAASTSCARSRPKASRR